MTKRSDEYAKRYTERLLGQVSSRNQAVVRNYVGAKRAQGLRPTSLMNVALSMRHLDQPPKVGGWNR